MAFISKLLGKGSTGAGAIYSLPTSTAGAIVSNLRFVNTQTSQHTLNLYFKPYLGSTIRIYTKDYPVPAGDILVVKPELTMGPGDAIEATTSAAMEYVVCGLERE